MSFETSTCAAPNSSASASYHGTALPMITTDACWKASLPPRMSSCYKCHEWVKWMVACDESRKKERTKESSQCRNSSCLPEISKSHNSQIQIISLCFFQIILLYEYTICFIPLYRVLYRLEIHSSRVYQKFQKSITHRYKLFHYAIFK